MSSTPAVCLTNIEHCMNRPLMTIIAHLLNITISSSSHRTQEFEFEIKGLEFERELEFMKELVQEGASSRENSSSRLEENSELTLRHRSQNSLLVPKTRIIIVKIRVTTVTSRIRVPESLKSYRKVYSAPVENNSLHSLRRETRIIVLNPTRDNGRTRSGSREIVENS